MNLDKSWLGCRDDNSVLEYKLAEHSADNESIDSHACHYLLAIHMFVQDERNKFVVDF